MPHPTPAAHRLAAAVMVLYGVVALVGGIIGFVNKNSKESVAAGTVACLLLLFFAMLIRRLPAVAFIGAVLVSLSLVGRFAMVLWKNREQLASYTGETAGIVAVIMILGGLLVAFMSAIALSVKPQPPA